MSMTDPIADMLTRIRNAVRASYHTVDIPSSKLKIEITKILKSEGFIRNYRVINEKGQRKLKIFLKYDENGELAIRGLKRVSKPSRRVYEKSKNIPKVLNGFGINIVSTSKGMMTDRQARGMGIGGEIVCSIW